MHECWQTLLPLREEEILWDTILRGGKYVLPKLSNKIRKTIGHNSGIILKNRLITNQHLTEIRRPEVRKRRMIGTESANFCEQRPVNQSTPLSKNLSPSGRLS